MSQLVTPSPFAEIDGRLQTVASRYRGQQVVRGLIVWFTGFLGATLLVALLAHLLGAGTTTRTLAWLWALGSIAMFVVLVVRPVMRRMEPLGVARLIESRVDGLHDGLSNGLLLSSRDDMRTNPWLPHVLSEIVSTTRATPLDRATDWRDVKPVAKRCAIALVPILLVATIFSGAIAHGMSQMFRPTSFVPRTGSITLLELTPADGATVVRGQPLEIMLTASVPTDDVPPAYLILSREGHSDERIELAPVTVSGTAQQIRYTHRIDHVEQSFRLRAEVGSTQSDWRAVNVVQQIKLSALSLNVIAPTYTARAPVVLTPNLTDLRATRFEAPQGSRVTLNASFDAPAGGAMLQLGEQPPVPMKAGAKFTSFSAEFDAITTTSFCVLLTDGSGQIIARLPEAAPTLHVLTDSAPVIDMRWPTRDVSVPTTQPIEVKAVLRDDWGVTSGRLLIGLKPDEPLTPTSDVRFTPVQLANEFSILIDLPAELRQHGRSIRVQVQASDNRALPAALFKDAGAQTVTSPIFEIRFRDEQQLLAERKEQADKLRQVLMDLLKLQQDLHTRTIALAPAVAETFTPVNLGQTDLRARMNVVTDTYTFDEQTQVIRRTLQMLSVGAATEAVDLSVAILNEPAEVERAKLARDVQSRQRRIISTLESLLAMLNTGKDPVPQATTRPGGDLLDKPAELSKLNEALKEYMAEQKRILDQTANLAKKPVDNFDDDDKKKLDELAMSQEKLDAFMLTKVRDLSAQAEQDMSNAALLKELLEVYSEVTMAKDALKKGAVEIAVAAEEMALELASALSANLEKWLVDTPDKTKWTQEDMLQKTDVPMVELPKELEDMIGELMEQQEDIMEEAEDTAANWTDSLDKGAGWDAADGPIANMSAKGVTGNQLPNNNDMGGRSGEGRSGRSQGEFVEETASGKGGRNTPTRLDPTPFQQGQITDTSKDPVGGATGGGKMSGQGGAGLEGPVPPAMKEQMQRLAQKQAELRNTAERLNLQYKLGKYDNFKMLESIALMRRVESDLGANRYQNILYRRDILLDAMSESRTLVGGQIHVKYDTTPQAQTKLQDDIHDAMQSDLPAAWSGALNEYYRKLSQ